MNEINEFIMIVTDVDKDDILKVGTETNEHGQIVRIFIIVNDEGTATKIVKSIYDAINDCKKERKGE